SVPVFVNEPLPTLRTVLPVAVFDSVSEPLFVALLATVMLLAVPKSTSPTVTVVFGLVTTVVWEGVPVNWAAAPSALGGGATAQWAVVVQLWSGVAATVNTSPDSRRRTSSSSSTMGRKNLRRLALRTGRPDAWDFPSHHRRSQRRSMRRFPGECGALVR